MSAADQGPAGSSLTREQVLDELEFLAKVEHALVIECLSVCYALGYDLGPDEGGPTTGPGTFSSLAVSAMRVMDDTNRLLAQRGLLPPFTFPLTQCHSPSHKRH